MKSPCAERTALTSRVLLSTTKHHGLDPLLGAVIHWFSCVRRPTLTLLIHRTGGPVSPVRLPVGATTVRPRQCYRRWSSRRTETRSLFHGVGSAPCCSRVRRWWDGLMCLAGCPVRLSSPLPPTPLSTSIVSASEGSNDPDLRWLVFRNSFFINTLADTLNL